jgi:hypothetical protein
MKKYYWVKSRTLADWVSKDKGWKLGMFQNLPYMELHDELYIYNLPRPTYYGKLRLKELRAVFNYALNDEIPIHTWISYDNFGNPTENKTMLWDIVDNLFGPPKIRDHVNFAVTGTPFCEPHTCKLCWTRPKSSIKHMCEYCKKQRNLDKTFSSTHSSIHSPTYNLTYNLTHQLERMTI